MKQSKKFTTPLIACAALIIVLITMLMVYNRFKPDTNQGTKEITVEVVIPDVKSEVFKIQTDSEYLRQALEEASLIKGSEEDFGLYITEVNGRIADNTNQEWWCITKEGAQIYNGVDTIPIADHDKYEITLMVGF